MTNEKNNTGLNLPQVAKTEKTEFGSFVKYNQKDKIVELTIRVPFNGEPNGKIYESPKTNKIYFPIVEIGNKFSSVEVDSQGFDDLFKQTPDGKMMSLHLKTSLNLVISDLPKTSNNTGFSFKI